MSTERSLKQPWQSPEELKGNLEINFMDNQGQQEHGEQRTSHFSLEEGAYIPFQGSLSVTTYLTRFRALIDEIDNLSPIPKCSCVNSNCTCGYGLKLANYEQIHKLSQFLMGLSDQFTGIRGQLLMMTPLPTLSQAYSLLLQEEVRRDCTSQCPTIDNVAMNVRFTGSKQHPTHSSFTPGKKSVSNDSVYCDFCHSSGHIRDKYFCVHGYPDWHRLYGHPKPKPRSGAQSTVRKVAQVTGPSTYVPASASTTSGGEDNCSAAFTEAQCHQLDAIIQSSIKAMSPWNASKNEASLPLIGNISSYVEGTSTTFTVSSVHTLHTTLDQNKISWILDSGATDHITCHFHLFENPTPLTSLLYLPDGTSTNITHIGTIHLPNNILLTQDLHQKRRTEMGNFEGGLYKYNHVSFLPHSTATISTVTHQATLWHARLGHPSAIALNKIDSVSTIPPNLFTHCDVCHQAKQTRLSFSDSTSISSHLFELVHCVIWGPYKTCTHGKCKMFLTIVEDFSKCTWTLRSDNGTEFVNHSLSSFLASKASLLYHTFTPSYQQFLAHTASVPTPSTYSQAIKYPVWCEAMKAEILALESNDTWDLVPMPSNTNIVDCKWIYKVKYRPNGDIERYKARLVAKGFTQTSGVDYFETFAPVAKMNTLRVLLALAATHKWHLLHMDVTNAFLHGDLHEVVYMRLPPGLHTFTSKPFSYSPFLVCKLKKSLYDLKQAPREWFTKLSKVVSVFGMLQNPCDHSLYTLSRGSDYVAILIYVDDILVTGNSATLIGQSSTSAELSVKDISIYRRLVGRLIYLTISRPELSYPVHILAQFIAKPKHDHLQAAYKVVRYLKNAPGQDILFLASNSLTLRAFSDADWGAVNSLALL
ncbi:uncharacterized protein LOC141720152 [Apium graveolens]|uniref:uncharacterized protein LOC141720152 n=1 Tax=Apium graveolens TaxID=4045 RepID=UPI003D7A5601